MYTIANDRIGPGKHYACNLVGRPVEAVRGAGWRRHFRVLDTAKVRHAERRMWPSLAWPLISMAVMPVVNALLG